ncbi:TonB-dependent receptor [Myxococcota bacterium]
MPMGMDMPSDAELDAAAAGEDEAYFDDEIEIVTVTVDRREKDLQDYSGAASVFKQEDLDRTGVESIREMGTSQPYADISNQEGNTEIYVRGIGSNNNTELGDPAVASHVDGIYIARPKGVGSMLFDLERIEINRGPQGTLRGRNATGGSVNIVTAKPKLDEWQASASLQFGNYSQRLTRGMLNIPMGDQLALRLATFTEVHDPFYKNAGPIKSLKASDSADTLAYRVGLKWLPIEEVSVVVQHDYTQEGGTGWSGSNLTEALIAGLMPDEIEDPRAVIYRGPQGAVDLGNMGVNGQLTFDLGPLLIGVVSGYRYTDFRQTNSGMDGVAYAGSEPPMLDDWSTTYWHQTSHATVQELRLFAPDTARFRWTVGGFFFNEEQITSFANTQDNSTGFAGVEYTMPDMHSHSWAAFFDATYDIVDYLRGIAGVRYSAEAKSRSGIGNNYSVTGVDEPFRYGTEAFGYKGQDRTDYDSEWGEPPFGVPPKPYDDFLGGIARFGERDTLADVLQQPGVGMADNLNEQHGEYENDYPDFRVGVEGDLTKDNLVYAIFSTGHKSGGFNDDMRLTDEDGVATGTLAKTYKPETLYSTEIGSKNEFFERQLLANFAAFWYEYLDQQFQIVQSTGPAPAGGGTAPASAVRLNASNSRIFGMEADLTAHLPAYFTAGLAGQFLYARFTKGKVPDTRSTWDAREMPSVNLEGNTVPRSPALTVNFALGQTIPTDYGYFDWLVQSQIKTKYYMTIFNSEGYDTRGNYSPVLTDVVPTYGNIDVGIGYTRPNGKLRVDAFVNNLTDSVHMTTFVNQPGMHLRFFNPPRQFGTRLSVNY